MMKYASTRMSLMGIALGAAAALCTLPLGHDAAAQGSANAAGAVKGAVSAAARVGGISAGLGAASDTSAAAGISRTSSSDSSGDTIDHTTAVAADASNANDVDLDVGGPKGNGIDAGVATGADLGGGAAVTRTSSAK